MVWLFFFSLTALVVPFEQERKKRKMVIVNLEEKKPHTQGITTDASTKMDSPFKVRVSLPAGTELTQLSLKDPSGRTEVKGRNRGTRGDDREATEDWRTICSQHKCLTACTPGRTAIFCHELAEDEPGR